MYQKWWKDFGEITISTQKKKKTWVKVGTDEEGKPLKRAFCAFVMEPIIKLANAIMNGENE